MTLIGWAFVASLFVPLVKPLTGVRELMLAPDVVIYAVALKRLFLLRRNSISRAGVFGLLCFAVFYAIALAEFFNPNVPSTRVAFEGFRKTAHTSIAFFVGLALAADRERATKILRWIMLAGCIVALYAVKQAVWWSDFDCRMVQSNAAGYWTAVGWGGKFRSVGTLSGPFHLGILGIQIFCLGRLFQTREGDCLRGRVFAMASMLLGALAVLTSQTRTNYVGLVLIGGAMILMTERSVVKILVFQSAAIAAALLMIAFVSLREGNALAESIRTLAHPLSDNRFLNRFNEIEEMLRAIRARPWTGYGIGAAGDALDRAFPEGRVHFTGHNVALKLLVEMGVAGLLAFAGVLLGWAGRAYRVFWNRRVLPEEWRFQLMLAALILPVLFNGLTGSGIEAYPTNLFMWFGLGASLAVDASLRPPA